MRTRLLTVLSLLLLATNTHAQQTNLLNVAGPSQQVRGVSYQQTQAISQVLGNPFGDDAVAIPSNAPAPVVQHQPAPVVSQAALQMCPPSCDAGPSCGAAGIGCDTGPVCGAAAPSCGLALGCDSGCDSGCDAACGGGCGFGLCDCNLGDAWTLSGALHGDCPPSVNIGGWLSAGYHSADNGLFNNRPDKLNLHQGWLYAEKAADCSSPIGFRIDAMYGIDAGDTQAFGNPSGSWDYENGFDHGSYGFAIPQAYIEMMLTESLSVKVGHFYTLIGYEVVTAPDNFFYSHAMTMFNSEPFTHTGALFTKTAGDLTFYGGWTSGWDTGFDQLDDGSSWLGGFSTPLGEDITFTYISTAGNFGWRGDDAYSHSLVFDTTLTDNLNYVLQSDVLRVKGTGEDNVGINQYFLYTVSDCLGLGARVEWWKSDTVTGYVPHNGMAPANGSYSSFAATFGANIRPHANLVLRPEVRYDWSPAANYDESYFGIDAVMTF